MSDSISEEIEGLLKKLLRVNDQMSEIVAAGNSNSNSNYSGVGVIHTIQRHREILQDYSQEFRKTQNNVKSRKEREELLSGVKKEIE
jgi:Golgi SNAP receptor complex protein 1